MNSIFIIGNIGQKPVIKTLQSGDKVANFSVGTASGFGQNKKTIWFSVSIFGKTADVIEQYTDKGSKILVQGRLEENTYTDKNGVEKTAFNLVGSNIQLLSQKEQQEQATQPAIAQSSVSVMAENSDDLPF
jgi:single-strand DNA-binding protein